MNRCVCASETRRGQRDREVNRQREAVGCSGGYHGEGIQGGSMYLIPHYKVPIMTLKLSV